MATVDELLAKIAKDGFDKDTFKAVLQETGNIAPNQLTPEYNAALEKFSKENPEFVKKQLGKVLVKEFGIDLKDLEKGKKAKVPTAEADIDLTKKSGDYIDAQKDKFKRMGADEFARNEADYTAESYGEVVKKQLRVTEDRYGDITKVELKRDSALGEIKKKIDELHRDKERITERDPSNTKKINELNKALEEQGKRAQREIHEVNKGIEEYSKGLDEAHSKRMYKLEDRHAELKDAIDSIDHKGKKGSRQITIEGEDIRKSLLVETKQGQYRINEEGVELVGRNKAGKNVAVKDLSNTEIGEIKKVALERIDERYNAKTDAMKARHEAIQGNLKKSLEHVKDEIKTDVHTKTGVGEWNGKTASKITPGGIGAGPKGIMTEANYEKLSGLQKQGAKIKANWNSGFMGAVQTTVGAIGVLDGIRRAWQGVSGMMSSDPEKKEQAGAGTLVVGLAEIGGGILLAGAGGKAKATGMAI